MLGDLIATEHLAESSEFARLALSRARWPSTARCSRGVKQAPFVVLMGVQMPAALVEIGFITNAREEEALAARRRARGASSTRLGRAVVEFGRRFDAAAAPRRRRATSPRRR